MNRTARRSTAKSETEPMLGEAAPESEGAFLSAPEATREEPKGSDADLNCVLPPPTRMRFIARLRAALTAAGREAKVSLVIEQPLLLPALKPHRVLSSITGGCAPAVGVVLQPRSGHLATANAWAREAAGEEIVRRIAANVLPAHVAVRVLYAVPDRAGVWRRVDPPMLGRARLGWTYLERLMRTNDADTVTPNAMLIEEIADIRELFGLTIDPDADPGAYDEFVRRCRRRHQQRYRLGQLIDDAMMDEIHNRLATLERLVADLTRHPPGTRARGRHAGDIPLTS